MKFCIFILLSTTTLVSMESVPILKALAARACVDYEVNIKNVSNDIKEIIDLYKEKNLETMKIRDLRQARKIFLRLNDQKKARECYKELVKKRCNIRNKTAEVFIEVLRYDDNKLPEKIIKTENEILEKKLEKIAEKDPEIVLEIKNEYMENRERHYSSLQNKAKCALFSCIGCCIPATITYIILIVVNNS